MADLVNVGIAGRVYLRFNLPHEVAVLRAFQRCGARLDRERELWFCGEHNRDVALSLVVQTGGDATGNKKPDRDVFPPGGHVLNCGWVLVSANAGANRIRYWNPYGKTPDQLQEVRFTEARELMMNCRHAGLQLIMAELVGAAEAVLDGTKPRNPFQSNPKPEFRAEYQQNPPGPRREAGTTATATPKQLNAIQAMVRRLHALNRSEAEVFQAEVSELAAEDKLTISKASQIIDRLTISIDEARR